MKKLLFLCCLLLSTPSYHANSTDTSGSVDQDQHKEDHALNKDEHAGHDHEHAGHDHEHAGHDHEHAGHDHEHAGHDHAGHDHNNHTDQLHAHHDHDDHVDHDHDDQDGDGTPNHNRIYDKNIWAAAVGSIFIIGACGIFGVVVIPIMNRRIYQHAVQFLIALAVGTLTGDALLHLLPHAIMGGDHKHGDHGHGSNLQNDLHKRAVWIGFVAAMAIIGFFLFEKLVNILGELRTNSIPDKNLRVVREGHVASDKAVGENICKHKYSAYCVQDFDSQNERDESVRGNGTPKKNVSGGSEDPASEKTLLPVTEGEKLHKRNYSIGGNGFKPDQDTVIISHHENIHHGHSHAHSHIHSAPNSISSVAWMVIFGDGIHNLADGLAIGAAFADGMWSGISTSIAVLCHELPHEIGDFAMLLKTGMSFKKAVFYNVVSSVLAFLGMLVGLLLGNLENFSSWMFAATAGVFLYVALVDMMPELSSGHSHPLSKETQHEGNFVPLILQLLGMSTGVGIMTIIALYEEDFKTFISE
jgi:zinc transporter 10